MQHAKMMLCSSQGSGSRVWGSTDRAATIWRLRLLCQTSNVAAAAAAKMAARPPITPPAAQYHAISRAGNDQLVQSISRMSSSILPCMSCTCQ